MVVALMWVGGVGGWVGGSINHTRLVQNHAHDSRRCLSLCCLPQNDFLRPFVVVMRHSRAPEIRELIIRCASQMVLARASNIKSGWKSMFMVRQRLQRVLSYCI